MTERTVDQQQAGERGSPIGDPQPTPAAPPAAITVSSVAALPDICHCINIVALEWLGPPRG